MNVGFQTPIRLDSEPASGLNLRAYINFLWRHWMFIGAMVILALLVGFIYLARATPLYTATAEVLLDPRREKTAGTDSFLTDLQSDFSAMESQLTIIKSDPLLQRVAIKERLVLPPTGSGKEPQDAADEHARATEPQRLRGAVNRLRGALKVIRVGQSYAFSISVTWTDPETAARLANAVADAYVVDQLEARFEAAKRASAWLSDRLVELRQQLRDSEEAVAQFRKENGLGRTGPNVTLNEQQLSELNSKLLEARSDVAEKKARVDFLDDVMAGKKPLDSLPDSLQSSTGSVMAPLRAKLADASQREADLLARYSRAHPAVVNIAAEKRDIERSIAVETQRVAQTIRSEYALAKARESAMEQALYAATGQGKLDSEAAIRLRELDRTAAVNKSLFEDFLQKAKITDQQSTFQARDARVVMPAQPGGQSFPDRQRVLMTALLLGIGLGVGGAVAMEMLNQGFTTPREVEDLLGVPVLASVQRLEEGKLKRNGAPLPVPLYQIENPLSQFSEAMRTLRSGIHMSDLDRPPKVIHVTSARPGEGKTTIAVSLAISAALSGIKVVLIDADLRHPAATRFFELEQEKGLVDLLATSTGNDASMMFRKNGLLVIPAGSKSLNPPDVLASERMKALITHLKDNFDYVVIDSPPVGPVVDSVIIENLADKTIFVVQWASTARDLVETCVKKVSAHKRVGGIVLNFLKPGRAKKYGVDYHYGKHYSKYYSEQSA